KIGENIPGQNCAATGQKRASPNAGRPERVKGVSIRVSSVTMRGNIEILPGVPGRESAVRGRSTGYVGEQERENEKEDRHCGLVRQNYECDPTGRQRNPGNPFNR